MGSSEESEDSALWAFAAGFFESPGAGSLLMTLQDEDGLDVLFLLTLLHAGREGLELDGETIAALKDLSGRWQARAIRPLRAVRRGLKGSDTAVPDEEWQMFRDRVRQAEIEAEHLLLGWLEMLLPPAGNTPGTEATIHKNIHNFFVTEPQRPGEACRARLAQLLAEAAKYRP